MLLIWVYSPVLLANVVHNAIEAEDGSRDGSVELATDSLATKGKYVVYGNTEPEPPDVAYGPRYATTSTRTGEQIAVTPGTYDRVLFDGMVSITQAGNYTFRDCVIRSSSWGVFHVSNGSANITMEHCRLERKSPAPASGSSGSGVIHGTYTGTFRYNDISGMGDGVQMSGDNILFEHNWIHNLAYVYWGSNPADCGTATHNDGIQLYGSAQNVRILHNLIEPPSAVESPCSNSAIFAQGAGQSGEIRNNILRHGGYTLYIEHGTYAITGNKITPGKWGTHRILSGVTVTEWNSNTNESSGATLSR